ncbi:MAG: TGS domain-containing protein [archaeon]
MVVNATPAYQTAEKQYLIAKSTEEKINAVKNMITLCPKHKGSEKMLAALKKRLARLKEEILKEKEVRKRRGHNLNIKKEQDAQVVMIGMANSGKSTILSKITNASPQISELPYTTFKPEIGTLEMGCKIQIIEVPSLKPGADNKELLSLAETADLILAVVSSIEDLKFIGEELKQHDNKVLVINKKDIIKEEKLKMLLNMKNSIAISAKNEEGIKELKQKIFDSLCIMRVYTKEPGKKQTLEPLVLKKGKCIEDVSRKIRQDYVKRFVYARVWGDSAKFAGQKVGIKHILKDKDVIEIHLD